ncbi:hypothetical protein HON01_05105, partial [Candidatus Woesearchaeota archaeon]|nr:hypothetical protein [Candidatus Woesearchaeota archaeon]
MANRIEVKYKLGIDSRGEVIKNKLISLMEEGAIPQANINSVDVVDSYTINKNVPKETLKLIAESLTNPVSQIYQIDDSFKENCDFALEIGFKPGVTDNVATTARKGIEAKLNELFDTNESVHSTRYLLINGQELNQNILNSIGNILANPLIENIVVKSGNDFLNNGFLPYVPQVILENKPTAMVVPIRDISESELKLIAKQGILDPITKIRRGPLALDVDEGIPIKIIQQH